MHFSNGSWNSWGVFIAFYGNQDIINNKLSYKNKQILVLVQQNDGFDFFSIYIYNVNTEKEKVSVLNKLNLNKLIFAGDVNVFFDTLLDAKCDTITLKSWSIHKLIDLNQMLDFCDIWRIKNPKKKHTL